MLGIHKPGSGNSEEHSPPDQRRANHILIWLTVGVLVVGFLALRKMGSDKAAPTLGYPGNTPTGGTGGGDGVGGGFASLNQQLAALSTELAQSDANHSADIAALDASWSAQFADSEQTNAEQSNWITNLTDKLASSMASIEKLGGQVQQNTTTISGLSQSDSAGPSGLDQGLIAQMRANGEYVVDSVKSTSGGMLYLTNKGGVYGDDGAPFFGSYLGYASKTSNPQAEIAGHGDFSSGDIQALAGGSYSLVNNRGETYTFNQETKAKGY